MVLLLRIFDRELQVPARHQRLIFNSRHLITNKSAHAAGGPVARNGTASTIAEEVRLMNVGGVEVEDRVGDHLGYQGCKCWCDVRVLFTQPVVSRWWIWRESWWWVSWGTSYGGDERRSGSGAWKSWGGQGKATLGTGGYSWWTGTRTWKGWKGWKDWRERSYWWLLGGRIPEFRRLSHLLMLRYHVRMNPVDVR